MDFGTDIDCVLDLAVTPMLVSGAQNLANALVRRLTTTPGTLSYDPDYGLNVRTLLNGSWTLAFQDAASAAIESECKKDDRVLSCSATLTYNWAAQSFSISIAVSTAAGPFDLVVSINAVTVALLKVTA